MESIYYVMSWLCHPVNRLLLLLSLTGAVASAAGLDHSRWDGLVHKYVTEEARVDYSGMRQHGVPDLEAYLKEVAAPWPAGMTPPETKAALINAYNSLTVHWVLANYPLKSIWRTDNPFRKARHTVDGKAVSLDQIEGRLRDMKDARIHAAIVCAARSCPPLRREAYTGAKLEQQLDDNSRRWLANRGLNEFVPEKRAAHVSGIFKWYAKDFGGTGGVKDFLAKYGPNAAYIDTRGSQLDYMTYHWGLNDVTTLGSDYSQWDFYRDQLRLALPGH